MTAKNNPEEIARRHTRNRFDGDDPFTIYECPVCKTGVALGEVAAHLRSHGQLPEHLEDEIADLRHVANQVMASYGSALNKAKRAESKNSRHQRGLHSDSIVGCPICRSRIKLIDYVDHWAKTHRHESAKSVKDRKRVEYLYKKSRAVGGRRERKGNPYKVKDGRKVKLGKGTGVKQVVSGGLPSLGKRR